MFLLIVQMLFKVITKIFHKMASDKTKSSSIGLLGFIFLVFLTLKLAEIGQVATWSWWWVTCPLWIPLAIVLLFLFGFGFIMAIAVIFGGARIKVVEKEDESQRPKKKSLLQERLEQAMQKRKES